MNMKKLLCLILLAVTVKISQAQDYQPFPTDDAQWIVKRYNAGNGGPSSTSYSAFTVSGDTLINDTIYHKVYLQFAGNPDFSVVIAGMREEAKRVFVREFGMTGFGNLCVQGEGEHLIYDFNIDAVGDSLYLPTNDGLSLFVTQSIDSVEVAGTYRTRWTLAPYEGMCSPFWYTYVEGIGSDRHPFGQIVWMTSEISFSLSCMTRSGVFEYSMYPEPPLCDLDDFVEVSESVEEETFNINFDGQQLFWNSKPASPITYIDVYTISGQRMQTAAYSSGSLSMGSSAAGFYVVQLRSINGIVHRQLVSMVR
jgi:hypothetical protein